MDEQMESYENARQLITGHPNTIYPTDSPSPTIEDERPSENKYLVDSYRELVEENQNLRNSIAFFIRKLRYRDKNLVMVQIKGGETSSLLINSLHDEINRILQETKG